MALRQAFMVKSVIGEDMEIQAKTGESILVKNIYVKNPSSDFAVVSIDKTTVGYFMVGGNLGNHLHFPKKENNKSKNILDFLSSYNIFKGYPVAEGQTLKINGCVGPNTRISIIYEVYDAGDIHSDMENGSNASKYMFLNYADTGNDINSSGDFLLKNSLLPSEFPEFPFGKDVPAKTKITLYGVLASDISISGSGSSTDFIRTKYLKMIKERTVLFDDLKNGIIFEGKTPTNTSETNIGNGNSFLGMYTDIDGKYPLIFPKPLVFEGGEELGVYITTEKNGAGATIPREYQRVGLIEFVERV